MAKSTLVAPLAVFLLVAKLSTAADHSSCAALHLPDYVHCPISHPIANSSQTPRVSVVVMNWNRPENVKKMVTAMVEYSNVREVIIVMNNPDTRFDFKHNKVVSINLSGLEEEWGVAVRFKACLLAASKWVLAVDDDIFVKEAGLQRMIDSKLSNPESIVSFWGRNFDEASAEPAYSNAEVQGGRYPIALTKAMLVDFRFCEAFFRASHLVANISRDSSVTWNGEDIFMSMVALKVTGEKATILEWTADDLEEWQDSNGISVRDTRHLEHRTMFLRATIQRLSCAP